MSVAPDLTGFHKKIRAGTANMPNVNVNVQPDLNQFGARLQEATRTRTATVNTNANTAVAEAQINHTARNRSTTISVNTDTNQLAIVANALNNVGGSAGAASGRMSTFQRVALITGVVAAAAAPALGLISTAILGIPGAVAVGGIALGAIILGMDGIKRAAEAAAPAFDALKAAVSSTFAEQLLPVFQQIGTVLLPGITAGLQGTAVAVSGLFAAFIGVLTSVQGMQTLNAIIGYTNQFLTALQPMVVSVTQGFLTLALVGSQALAAFAPTLVAVGAAFQAMVDRLAGSGVLLQAFNGLGQVVGSVLFVFLQLLEVGAHMMAVLGGPLAAMITGLGNVFVAIAPALTAFSGLIIGIITQLAHFLIPVVQAVTPLFLQLAAVLGTIFGAALSTLMPIITQLVGVLVAALAPILPVIANAVLMLLQALAPVISIVAVFVGQLITLLAPILGQVAMILSQFLTVALQALTPILMVLAQVLMQVFWAVAPLIPQFLSLVLMAFSPMLGILPALVPLIALIGQVFALILPPLLQVVFTLINALIPVIHALMPIFIMAFTAIAGIVTWALQWIILPLLSYVIIPVLQFLASVIQWLALNVFVPLFTLIGAVVAGVGPFLVSVFWGLVGAVQAVGNFFIWLYHFAFKPAWDAIAAAVIWVWTAVLLPTFNAISLGIRVLAAVLFTALVAPWIIAWNGICGAILWAWENIINPCFNWIAGKASWLWHDILGPVFSYIGGTWGLLWAGVRWVFDNVIRPCWDALAGAALWLWHGVLAPVFASIGAAWGALCASIRWVWDNVLRPCWDAVQAAAVWLWDSVLRPVFAWIGEAWFNMVRGIESAWNFILRTCWDAVAGAARWLWESVLRPVFDAIGAAWRGLLDGMNWVWLNVLRPMFDAIKNTIDWLARGFESAVNWIREIWSRMIKATADPINFVIDAVYNRGIVPAWGKIAGWLGLPGLQLAEPVRYAVGGKVHGNGNRDSVPAMLMPGEYVISKKVVNAWGMENIHSAHQAARAGKEGGVPAFAAGGPVHTWPQMWDIVRGMNIGAQMTSNFRPGDSGYHGKGQAIDLAGDFVKIADALGRRFPNATQIISGQWRGGTGILNGRPHYYAQDNKDHFDHVHWAMTPEALGGAGGGGLFDIVGLVVGWFRDTLMKPVMETAGQLLGKFGDNPYNQAPNKIPGKALDAGTEWVKGKAYDIWGHIAHLFSWMFGGGGGGGGFSGNAEQWRGLVIEALKRLGLPLSWADVTLNQIRTESGGNPRAVNNWDSNAARGTPSGGLLQTIAPTFAAYRDPALPNNMFDPFANIVASMRYAMARYGSLPAAYRGVGYAKGGPVIAGMYDKGGILPPTPGGYGLYANHSGRNEAVLTNEQMGWLRNAADQRGGKSGGDIYTTVNARTDASPEHIAHTINRHIGMKLRS